MNNCLFPQNSILWQQSLALITICNILIFIRNKYNTLFSLKFFSSFIIIPLFTIVLLFSFIGCSASKNRPLTKIASFAAVNVNNDIIVNVSVDYGDGTDTSYLKRLSPLRNELVSKLNNDANLNNNRIRFIGIDNYVNPFSKDSDYVLSLKCDTPKNNTKTNPFVSTLLWPTTLSVVLAPIGIIGMSIPGLTKSESVFNWRVDFRPNERPDYVIASKKFEPIKAVASGSGWGINQEAIEESYINTESHLISKTIGFLNGIQWDRLYSQRTSSKASSALSYIDTSSKAIADYESSGRQFALVIGINEYRYFPRLTNAVNDAKTIADILKKNYSFTKVTGLYNADATKARIVSAIRSFVKILREQDNLLIYYGGHGTYDELLDEGYWIPVNAKDQSDFVSNSEISKYIKAMEKTKHVFLVADACFSGTVLERAIQPKRKTDLRSEYLRKMDLRKSRMVLTSGAKEPVPDSGFKGHSSFAYFFIQALLSPDDEVFTDSELAHRVSKSVANNSRQTPLSGYMQDAGHENGQMVFKYKK